MLRFPPSAVLTDENAQRHLADRNVGLFWNSTVQNVENSFVHAYCRLASSNRYDVAAEKHWDYATLIGCPAPPKDLPLPAKTAIEIWNCKRVTDWEKSEIIKKRSGADETRGNLISSLPNVLFLPAESLLLLQKSWRQCFLSDLLLMTNHFSTLFWHQASLSSVSFFWR